MVIGKGKRVWLVQIGEELPDDPGPPRLLRMAQLARELVRRGHDVTYWNSSFNHQRKQQRAGGTTTRGSIHGYQSILLHGRAYKQNISWARFMSHKDNAAAFQRVAAAITPPDVIICGMPSIELAEAVSEYAALHNVPLAIDCRDMWPEIIGDHLPFFIRMASAPILAQWRRSLRRALTRASGIIGITEPFLEWALNVAARQRNELDRVFHLTVDPVAASDGELESARRYWTSLLGTPEGRPAMGVFAGTMSSRLDLMTIVEGARIALGRSKDDFRIILCGQGDQYDVLRTACADLPNIIVPGWKTAAELSALMERADFGILPYPSSPDFLNSFPNKVGEYLSFGIPILSGLEGVTGSFLDAHALRIRYEPGDPESAANAILTATADRAPLSATRPVALQAFRDYFNPVTIIGQYADYVESLAEGKCNNATSSHRSFH